MFSDSQWERGWGWAWSPSPQDAFHFFSPDRYVHACTHTHVYLALQSAALTLCGQINPPVFTQLPLGQASIKNNEPALPVKDGVSGESGIGLSDT